MSAGRKPLSAVGCRRGAETGRHPQPASPPAATATSTSTACKTSVRHQENLKLSGVIPLLVMTFQSKSRERRPKLANQRSAPQGGDDDAGQSRSTRRTTRAVPPPPSTGG